MAYSDKVIDHYENPRNVGKLEMDDSVGTGMVGRSSSCCSRFKCQSGIETPTIIKVVDIGYIILYS
jgi:nitrogen fixation NifU-like protein